MFRLFKSLHQKTTALWYEVGKTKKYNYNYVISYVIKFNSSDMSEKQKHHLIIDLKTTEKTLTNQNKTRNLLADTLTKITTT